MSIVFNGAASALPNVAYPTAYMGNWGETSWWSPDLVAQPGRGTRRVTLAADPLGTGAQVFRAELFAGDGDAIASLPGSRRSELSATVHFQTIGQTWWYFIRTLTPAGWQTDNGQCPTTLWQIHDLPDGGDPARGPPLEFEILGSEWLIYSRAAIAAGTNDGQVVRRITGGRLRDIVGSWQEWVIRATWSPTSAGALKIWRNRRVIFEETGQKNCYDDAVGLYPCNGVYCPVNWAAQGIASRVAYNSGMVVGESGETFASMAGAPELERVTPIALAAN